MIIPMFQGIYCGETGQRIGAEALARWFWRGDWTGPMGHPNFPPWPVVDKTALRFLVQNTQALEQHYGHLTLNICPDTLESPEMFAEWQALIQALKKKTDINVVGEITEEVSDATLRDAFDPLVSLDIPLYMDDFGRKNSTYSRLKRFPWDGCKFDMKGLVHEPSTSDEQKALRYCQSHGLTTVAEQVETENLVRAAKDRGFSWLQGFYFGRAEMLMMSTSDRRWTACSFCNTP